MTKPKQVTRQALFLQRLREARQRAGLTQVEAAKRFGKPQSYISKIETGERRVDYLELEDLARLYGTSPAFFTTRDHPRR